MDVSELKRNVERKFDAVCNRFAVYDENLSALLNSFNNSEYVSFDYLYLNREGYIIINMIVDVINMLTESDALRTNNKMWIKDNNKAIKELNKCAMDIRNFNVNKIMIIRLFEQRNNIHLLIHDVKINIETFFEQYADIIEYD